MILRTIVVDDERLARQKILRLLRREPDITVIGECGDGRQALHATRSLAPDLMFLDVQMPELDGFGVLEILREKELPVVVVVTAYDHLASRAFELKAIDYLVKPFSHERFISSLERARQQVEAIAHLRNNSSKTQG